MQAAERNRRRAPRILPYLSPAPSDDSHAAVRMRRSITAA